VDNDWSNLYETEVGTDSSIGYGKANTTAIVNQVGHIFSAAKACNDLVI